MSKAIALLAGLGAGYMKAEKDKKDQERRDAEEARAQGMYDANMADRQQKIDDAAALRNAGAPVAVQPVKPDTQDNIDVGANADEQAVAPGSFRVGAKSFASQGLADSAAAAANTPDAVRARVGAALTAQGKVVEADQLATSGIQAQAAKMALDKGKRDEAAQVMSDGIRNALRSGGPEALAKFMSDSHADGAEGARKFQAVTGPDGKWQMNEIAPDGTLRPISNSRYTRDDAGMAEAGFMLNDAIPDKDKLAHMLQVQEAERKAKHDEGILGVAKQNADTNEKYRKDQAENMRQQRLLEERKIKLMQDKAAAPGSPVQLTAKEMAEFDKEFSKRVEDEFDVKNATDDATKAKIVAQRTSITALGNALFQNNAQHGIPLTAGTVRQALDLASDRKNVRVMMVGGAPYEGVVVNGTPVITSGQLSPRAAAAPAPAIDPQIRSAPPGSFVRPGAATVAQGGVQPAAAADPMAAQYAQESSELNRGTRLDFSPAVKAYQQRLDAQKAAANAAALAAERDRAVALSKAQLGR